MQNKKAQEMKKQAEKHRKKMKKSLAVRIALVSILVIGAILSYVYYDQIFGEETIFTATYDSEFVNEVMHLMPKVIESLQIITIGEVVATIALLIAANTFVKSRRGVTVTRLICSFIRVIGAIVIIIVVLALWGVDTTALITGAGVLTLIVGLGLQSLIADVIAGLFIIFENEFNVGDIITVDGFRGEVVSIGIRTTKLMALGNVKIINNSDIRGVLNQTVEPSVAKAFVSIEYGESLARVEQVIEDNLKNIEIDGVLEDGLTYNGINELGASRVTLLFTAKCNEADIFAVQRAMNKELKLMFDNNDIVIPIEQIVVHAETPQPKKKASTSKKQ